MTEGHATAISALFARGGEAWPGFTVDLHAFTSFVTDRVDAETAGELDGAGLYLACACVAGDPRALAAFEKRYIATLDPALAHFERSGVAIEDIKQLVRVRFLIGEGGRPPRIADYSGAGDLRAWLRVAAVRVAISLTRKHRREDPDGDDALVALAAEDPGPELDLMKHTYRAEFAAAFRAAVRSLEPRQRNLLRHQILDDLSIDRIGVLYGVHRATAARWVAHAREALIAGVRDSLQSQLAVGADQLDSILQLIRSRLDLSLGAFLSAE